MRYRIDTHTVPSFRPIVLGTSQGTESVGLNIPLSESLLSLDNHLITSVPFFNLLACIDRRLSCIWKKKSYWSWLLFTNSRDIFLSELVKPRSHEIGCYQCDIALGCDRRFGHPTADMLIKLQSDWKTWTYIVAAYSAISGSKTSYVLSNGGSGVKHNSWKCLCVFQGNICACNCSIIEEIDNVTSFVHDLRQCTETTACFASVSLLTINMYSKLAFICKQLTITRKTVLCFYLNEGGLGIYY